jgi:hypothetical protein
MPLDHAGYRLGAEPLVARTPRPSTFYAVTPLGPGVARAVRRS